MSKIRFLLAATLATLLLSACGKAEDTESPTDEPPVAEAPEAPKAPADPAAPLGPGQTMTADGATVSVGAAASKVVTPAYAPIYPGAAVATSVVGESGVGPGGFVTYRTDAPPKQVIAFYRERMKATGKAVTMDQDMGGDVHMLTAGDTGEGKAGMQVIASPSGKGSEVQLTWSDE
ncbi:hypothetical protein GVN21_00565 [Caulobacter sp. SLTY]|uniref:hypothetical protein n=1 Tax=Caulobacter sp. SLTY TaxID=2683262 RepID=UPI0014130292|nr:hypothetical protein [Caulobacter sp. SLTY]NBB13843.1 hypothetical protein [Caulobacter sp. SLTY]